MTRFAPVRADAVAAWIDATVDGDGATEVSGVASLDAAKSGDMTFCSGGRWLSLLEAAEASVIIVRPGIEVPEGAVALRHPNPRYAYAAVVARLLPVEWPDVGVHSTAEVHPTAMVDGATIGPFAVIEAGAVVRPTAWVDAHAYVGRRAVVGEGSRVMPHAVIMERCELGARVWLQPGAVIGADGFGHVVGPEGVIRVPQLGHVVLEDDVEIGANACVDRAALDQTRIGRGSRLDNLVQVAHGARIGAHCLLAAFAGVAGGAKLGERVVMAGRTAVVDGIEVGSDVVFAGLASASRTVPSGVRLGGSPARRYRLWLREVAALRQLPDALRTLERLRRRVERLPKDDSQ